MHILRWENIPKECKRMKKEKNKLKVKENEMIRMENLLALEEKIEPNEKTFDKIMFTYSIGTKELVNKLEIMKDEFKIFYDYDLIDHINTRIKKPESIKKKMLDRGCELTYQEMIKNINDIAGIRVICPLEKDIFTVRNLIEKLPGVQVLKEKDYVTKPKESGYSSYHLVLEVPITLAQKMMYVKVEVQIRTMAMDFWASLEHKLKYKPTGELSKAGSKELVSYAKMVRKLDRKMMMLN